MDTYKVKKLNHPINLEIAVPGSKSITNRALFLAALGNGAVHLKGVLFSADSRYFLSSLKSLGFSVEIREEEKEVIVGGCGGVIPKKEAEIYVGSAGTAARFLTAMLALSEGVYTIQASEQMKRRPMRPLFEALEQSGAEFTYLEKEGFLPVRVRGKRGGFKEASLDISRSTQFLSALLMMAPVLGEDFTIHITSEKKDGSYIRITRKLMEQFGVECNFDGDSYHIKKGQQYQREVYEIEPDVSAACYFYAMAAINGGVAKAAHVHFDSSQGDVRFLRVLEKMGCTVTDEPDGICLRGPEDGILHGVDVVMSDFSDQTMTLAATAVFAKGDTTIHGVAHIRRQESNRMQAIVNELTRLGISCEETEDGLIIHPKTPKCSDENPVVIQTYEDHRMAMAFAVIGTKVPGIRINDPYCCRKTFENYFEWLTKLNLELK